MTRRKGTICSCAAGLCLALALVLELLPNSVKLVLAPGPEQITIQYVSHIHPTAGNLVFPPATLVLTILALLGTAQLLWGRHRVGGERMLSLLLTGCAALSAAVPIVLQPSSVCALTVIIALLLFWALLLQLRGKR